MATHGSIGEFDPEKEDWTSYTERVEEYFVANDVDDATKQRAILLSNCGSSTYQLAKQLFSPTKLKELTSPKPIAIAQRRKFNGRYRQPGESVAVFCAELRKLAEFCEFGDSLEDMLRDRLVCRISDKRIQRRLLGEADLTHQKTYDLATVMESTQKESDDLQQPTSQSAATLHAVRGSNTRPG